MRIRCVVHLALAAFLFVHASSAEGRVEWRLEESDGYSRVVCRVADRTEGAFKERLVLEADEDGIGRKPRGSCRGRLE